MPGSVSGVVKEIGYNMMELQGNIETTYLRLWSKNKEIRIIIVKREGTAKFIP